MTPQKTIAGLHHVTAITANPQKNIDFYCDILGLRLVKFTVNFDDPSSYHLYYADELGSPGSVLTFFAWPDSRPGQIGPPQVSVTAYAVPLGSLDFWSRRFKEKSVPQKPIVERFGNRVLGFSDFDGTALELIAVADPKGHPWSAGPIPVEHAVRGFHSITISEEGYENTANLLTSVMGFKPIGTEVNRFRFQAGTGDGFASIVDLLCVPVAKCGALGAGVVHHVAFRTPDDPQQQNLRAEIVKEGLNVSPIMDRVYFHSLYYREPGGVLFEIATENPGFTFDEPASHFGTKLMLAPWLERHRAAIEAVVPPVRLPAVGRKERHTG